VEALEKIIRQPIWQQIRDNGDEMYSRKVRLRHLFTMFSSVNELSQAYACRSTIKQRNLRAIVPPQRNLIHTVNIVF
jgi:hypothetical protein